MHVTVERNSYGRQVDSRIVRITSSKSDIEAVFSGARIIPQVRPDTRVIATYYRAPGGIGQGHYMVTTFHPELTTDTRIHQRFPALTNVSLFCDVFFPLEQASKASLDVG